MHKIGIEGCMQSALLDNGPNCNAMVLKKHTREIVASNKFAQENGAIPGQTCFATCALRDDSCPFCLAPKLWENDEPQSIEVEHKGRWYDGRWVPLSEDLYVHYIFDITERKHSEDALLESERCYRSLFDNNHSVMLLIDPETASIVDANPLACNYYGYDREALIQMKISDINCLPEHQVIEEMGKAEKEKSNHFNFKHRLASGDIRDVEVYSGPVRVQGKRFLYSIIHDITQRRLAAEALRESEERFRLSIEYAPEAITIYDIDLDCFVDCNIKATELFGCSREEFLAGGAQRFFPAEQPDGLPVAESIANHNRKALAGDAVLFERAIRRSNGQIILCETRLVQLPSNNRKLMRASFFDITERKLIKVKLQENELKFRLLADHTYDWEYWINPEGDYIYLSPSCERITGYSPEEFTSNPKLLFDIVRPDYVEKVCQHYRDENNKEVPLFSMEFPITTKNGEERWLEHHCSPVFDEQGNYAGRRGNNRDITERKQVKAKLRESEERFKKLSNLTVEGILIHNKGVAIDVNESLVKMFGYTREELIGTNLIELLITREDHATINKNIVKTIAKPYEVMARKKDGTLFPVEIESRDIKGATNDYRATALRDITERKWAEREKEALEAHLQQAHKMEAIGTMAGGIAHDFNNFLSIEPLAKVLI